MSIQTLLLGLLVFNVIICIHELGHYWAARSVGMVVPEFSVGFGPRLFSFQVGETEFVFRPFPLGGFVLLPDLAPEDGILTVSRKRRAVALLAGPLLNLLAAVLLIGPQYTLTFVGMWGEAMAGLFTGSGEAELSGLVEISQAVGAAASYGWRYLLQFGAFLSLNFGLLNLLPIPGLDGGKLLGLLAEWANGGRRPRWEPAVQAIGILAVVGLGLWVTGAELWRLFN